MIGIWQLGKLSVEQGDVNTSRFFWNTHVAVHNLDSASAPTRLCDARDYGSVCL